MSYNRPKVDGVDDITGELLVKRPDDNPVCHLLFCCREVLTDVYPPRKRFLDAWRHSTKPHLPF